jgi:hypothetical protein
MIQKIISGGQTGVDQAALDVAMELGIPHGGWVPKGRKTENGRLPDKYKMEEMPTPSYFKRTERNVIEANGTLIIFRGKLKGGSELTQKMAYRHRRPCLHVDLNNANAFKAAMDVKDWILSQRIEVLNVAGPRASEDPEIYELTVKVLKAVLYLYLIDANIPGPLEVTSPIEKRLEPASIPRTVEEAVTRLMSELSRRDKAQIAYMTEERLVSLHPSLGAYIREKFRLCAGNKDLIESCRAFSKSGELHGGGASATIIHKLWEELRKSYILRLVR